MPGLRLLIPLAALLALALPASATAGPGLLAPASACPKQSNPGAATTVQLRAMRCLTNFARRQRGKRPLAAVGRLYRAGRHKSADILRCDDFDHEACGREFTYWFDRDGYGGGPCVTIGENIAWGTGSLGSPRRIFRAWLHSPGHRANILGEFEDLGLGLRIGRLGAQPGAHVWTQAFGSRGC